MKTIGLMLIGVVILVAIAVVLAVIDRGYEPEPVDHRDLGLPDRPLTAADVVGLRFRVGWRGYRMEDVDAALERLSESLRVAQGDLPPAAQMAPVVDAEPIAEADEPDPPSDDTPVTELLTDSDE